MGWKPDEFWNCTPSWFYQCYAGYSDAQNAREMSALRQTRLIAFYCVAGPRIQGRFKMTDVFELPGDNDGPKWESIDPERLKRFNEQADAALAELAEKRKLK